VSANAIPDVKSRLGFEDPWVIHTALVLGYPEFKQSGMVARQYRPVNWFRPGAGKP
jgi:hypothetical protein